MDYSNISILIRIFLVHVHVVIKMYLCVQFHTFHTNYFSHYAITPQICIILLSDSYTLETTALIIINYVWTVPDRDSYLHYSAVGCQGLIFVSFSPLTCFANTVLHVCLCTANKSIANFSPWSQILKVRGGLTVGWWGTDLPASNVTWHTNILPHPQQQTVKRAPDSLTHVLCCVEIKSRANTARKFQVYNYCTEKIENNHVKAQCFEKAVDKLQKQ